MPRPRLASLGMYDFPWLHAANDALWHAIAQRLAAAGWIDVPAQLERTRPLAELWRDPTLLLAQTCGYPLRTQLAGHLRIVATPRYAAAHARGAWHRSALIVPAKSPWRGLAELRGSVAAVNAYDSNTGMNLLRAAVAPHAQGPPFFARVAETGAHLASLAAVARGAADLAAIDGVTFELIARHRPELLREVRLLGLSAESPGLPLVTRIDASDEEVALLRAVLQEVAIDPALAETRIALALEGFEVLPDAVYDRVLELEREAVALGYPRLA